MTQKHCRGGGIPLAQPCGPGVPRAVISTDQFVSSRLGQVELSCSAHVGAGLPDDVEASLTGLRRD